MTHYKVLHVLTLCCVMLLLGCSKTKTTPKGPIGYFDLRSYLPADVAGRAPADSVAQEYTQQIDVGRCSSQAKVLAHWRAFKDGKHAYLLSASFEVLEAAQDVEISVGKPHSIEVKISVDEQGNKTSVGDVPSVNFNKASGGDLPGNHGGRDAVVETFEFRIDIDKSDGCSRCFSSVRKTIYATGELISD